MQGLALDVGAPPGVVGRVGPPVEGGRDDVVAALRVGVVVAAGLDDVDLARLGPGPVGRVDGHHPDGGPEPVTDGELGGDLDAAVLDGRAEAGVEAAGQDGRHDGGVAIGDVCVGDAVGGRGGGAGAVFEEVDLGVLLHERVVLRGGFDDEVAVLDEDVLVAARGLFELAVAVEVVSSVYIPERHTIATTKELTQTH